MKKLVIVFSFMIAVIGAFAVNVQAVGIYGYTSFSGTLDTDGTTLGDSTTITGFSNVTVSTLGGLDDYAPVLGGTTVGLYSPFNFTPFSALPLDFWVIDVGGVVYSYDVLSAQIDVQTANTLNLSGTGTASITGFDTTDSIWFLSATSAADRATFTLSTLVPPDYQVPSTVPEPTTLVLLGVGLLGLAKFGRKKR